MRGSFTCRKVGTWDRLFDFPSGGRLRCADISFNRQCLNNKVVPRYARIKVPKTSPASTATQNKIHTIRIKDEIKFLQMKKKNSIKNYTNYT
jgi:hypothetical protein